MAVTSKDLSRKPGGVKGPRSFLQDAMFALAGVLFILALAVQPIRVEGSSMMHSLRDREMMLVAKYDCLPGEPQRFDVVVCHYPGRGATNFVKRIVGLPGRGYRRHTGWYALCQRPGN